MAVQTRPYFMTLEGVDHMVEATGPAQAVRHIVGAALTELRPARGAEVAAWVRAGKDIPIAGQKTPPATAAGDPADDGSESQDDDATEFTAGDAFVWLSDWSTAPSKKIEPIWKRIVASQRMTLEDFDTLRTAVPKFGDALAQGVDDGAGEIGTADIRAHLEDKPMDLAVIVGLIGEAKRAELFEGVVEPLFNPKVESD